MRAVEWIASPRQVRVFHGEDSTVLDRPDIDAAKRQMHEHPEVVINGITLDESDIDSMRAAMTDAYQQQMQDWRAELSMGEF